MPDKQEFVARPLEGRALYESHVEQYRQALQTDFNQAHQRFGFVFFHGLSPRERVEMSQQLGVLKGDAVDEFNLATLAAQRDQFEEAKARLEKALKLRPDFFEAAAQMAAVCERLGDAPKAREWGQKALDLAPEDEVERLEEQVRALGGATGKK